MKGHINSKLMVIRDNICSPLIPCSAISICVYEWAHTHTEVRYFSRFYIVSKPIYIMRVCGGGLHRIIPGNGLIGFHCFNINMNYCSNTTSHLYSVSCHLWGQVTDSRPSPDLRLPPQVHPFAFQVPFLGNSMRKQKHKTRSLLPPTKEVKTMHLHKKAYRS